MDKETDKIIRQYIDTVANQSAGFYTAYVFGSYAKNMQTLRVTFDIALIYRQP